MYDTKLILKAAGAVTSSGAGSAVEVGSGRINARLVIDVSAIEIDDDDEIYTIHLLGGDDASFTEQVSLAALQLGASGASGMQDNVDTEVGRFEIPVTNEKGGTIYPYVKVGYVIAGTIATGINFAARLEDV